MGKLKAIGERWQQCGRRFFSREAPEDIWELNKQMRQMEARATRTITVAVAITLVNIIIFILS